MDFTATSLPCSKGGVSTNSTGGSSGVSLGRYGGGLGTLTSSSLTCSKGELGIDYSAAQDGVSTGVSVSLACSKGELGIDYSAVQDGVNSLVCYTGEQGSKSQLNKGVLSADAVPFVSRSKNSIVSIPKGVDPIRWSNSDWISMHSKVRSFGQPNAFGAKIAIPTPINLEFLRSNLHDFEDEQVISFLEFGWPIGTVGDATSANVSFPRNNDSAIDFPDDINKFIAKGLASNSLIGPFDSNPFDCAICVSPLGTVEKDDSTERRVILNMSWPPDSSVNDFIPEKEFLGEKFHFTYPKVDALVDLIKSKGRGCAVFKRDLKAAYRQLLRVDPGDIHLLGFSWNGKLFFDLTQPQGSRSTAFQCQRSSSAIRHIYRKGAYIGNR